MNQYVFSVSLFDTTQTFYMADTAILSVDVFAKANMNYEFIEDLCDSETLYYAYLLEGVSDSDIPLEDKNTGKTITFSFYEIMIHDKRRCIVLTPMNLIPDKLQERKTLDEWKNNNNSILQSVVEDASLHDLN